MTRVSRPDTSTLTDVVRRRSLAEPDRVAFTFLPDRADAVSWSYAQLDRRARAIAAALQAAEGAGERALLFFPSGLEFVAAFLGCLYAGVIAVPAPPLKKNRSERYLGILADADPRFLLAPAALLADVSFDRTRHLIATDELSDSLAAHYQAPAPASAQGLAYLQYTSGSTATPRGVMVTHANLADNVACIQQAFGLTSADTAVSWLPNYHDMGLVDGILQPLSSGCHGVILSPQSFIQRPIRWLEAISRFRASHGGGPNFAYDLCTRKITPAEMAPLDLSCWRSAYSGAEPVRDETLQRFGQAFAGVGFRRAAFYPCYGLAEATLMVSGGELAEAPVTVHLDAPALERRHVVIAPAGARNAHPLVGSGRPRPGWQLEIVDPESNVRCPTETIGEVWLAGPSVAAGYWRRSEESARAFGARLNSGAGPFLRTGDLGFMRDGELFITSRLKDLVIIRGRNHHPQDIEWTVENAHSSLRTNCVAAFAVEVAGEERLVIVAEVERRFGRPAALSPGNLLAIEERLDSFQPAAGEFAASEVVGAVRRAVQETHGLVPHAILLIKATTIPKTSSGKIMRDACRQGYLAGTLDPLASE